jgi:hypothetical protein
VVERARPPGSIRVLGAEIQTESITKRETSDFDPEVIHRGDMAVDRVVLHKEENAAAADDLVPSHGERLKTFANSGD